MQIKWITYVADSQHWANPCTSHDTWPHIQSTWPPVWPDPTATLRTHSNRWVRWLTKAWSYGAWCWKWGKSGLEGLFCKRGVSGKKNGWLDYETCDWKLERIVKYWKCSFANDIKFILASRMTPKTKARKQKSFLCI